MVAIIFQWLSIREACAQRSPGIAHDTVDSTHLQIHLLLRFNFDSYSPILLMRANKVVFS